MGLYRVDKDGKFDHWEWTGSVKGLVDAVGDGDARLGFVVDKKSGAKIAMNISGTDEPADEPFYVESSDGDNLYDAYNRREAVNLLNNARSGMEHLDETPPRRKKVGKSKSKSKRKSSPRTGIRGLR